MSTYINNRLFAYSYLPINNQEILNNYVNSLILIGSEQQIYQPLTQTYVGIGKTAYNNLLQQLDDSLPLFNSTDNFINHNFYLLSNYNNTDNEKNKQSYFNNNLYFNFDNNNNTYLNSSYFQGWLNGTSTYSLYSYNSDKITVNTNQDDNYYNILFIDNNNDLSNYKVTYINNDLQYNPSTGILKTSYFDGWLRGTSDHSIDTTYSTYANYSYNSYVSNLDDTQFSYIALYKNTGYQSTYIYSNLYYDKNNGSGNGILYTDINGNSSTATNANNSTYAIYAEQLKTEVNIWGQPFDGSSDVTGDLDLNGNKLLNVSNISPKDSNATIGGVGNKQFNTIYSQNFEGLSHDIQKILIPASNNASYSIILGNASNNKLWYYNDTYIKQTEIFTKKSLIVGTSGSNITNIPRSTLIYDSTNNIDYITDSIYSNGYQSAYKGFIHYGVLYNEGNINNANNYILLAGGGYMPVESLNADYSKYSYATKIYRTEENQTYYITFSNTDINGNYSSTYVDTSIKYNPLLNKLTIENGSVESYFIGDLNGKSQESYFSDNSTYSAYSYNSYIFYINDYQFTYIALYKGGDSYQPTYIYSDLYYDKNRKILHTNIDGNAKNLTGGIANQITYQTNTNNTGFIDTPTSNTYLKFDGTKFIWTSITDINTWRPIQSNTDILADSDTLTLLNGSGIELTYTSGGNITINHTNNITAGTAAGSATATLSFGETFTIPTISYDDQGHITSWGTTSITLPKDSNIDEKVKLYSKNDNKKYSLIFTYNDTISDGEISYISYNLDININPSTNTVYASYFNGWLKGTADNSINANHSNDSNNSTYSAYSYNSYVSYINDNQFTYIALYKGGNSYQPTYIYSDLYYDKTHKILHTSIDGNAESANIADVSNKLGNDDIGSITKGIYLNNGEPQEMTHSLNATVNSGIIGTLSYYNSETSIKNLQTSYGNTFKSIYIQNGIVKEGLSYAGGTRITLNGRDKGSSIASFYAPIKSGISDQILISNGTDAPTWGNIIGDGSISVSRTKNGITIYGTDTNIDEKVRLYSKNDSKKYSLLFAYNDSITNGTTSYISYDSDNKITINPSTNTVYASYFDGWLQGTSDHSIDTTYSTFANYSYNSYVSYINDYQFTYIALYKGGNSYQQTYIHSNLYYDQNNNKLHTNIDGNAESSNSSIVSTNLNGGNKNSIPYQTTPNTTDFITAPNNNTSYYSLTYHGTNISWQKEEELNVTSYTKTSNINITWNDFVNLSTTPVSLNNGTYIIQLIHNNIIYSGILSYRSNASGTDEIILHASGNPDNRLYLRTNGVILQISSTKTNLSNQSITIKLRRII